MKTSKQIFSSLVVLLSLFSFSSFAQDHPNILVIMVDDVAPNSLSAYTMGMQYPTPNIDRIAKEGVLFTDQTLFTA